jgi:hypothetical protein
LKEKDSRPALVIPPDLKAAFAKDPAAKQAFEALAYTHRKEHIQAIVDAKKPETRARRLAKTLEMLHSARPSRSNTVSTRPTPEKMRIAPGERLLVLDADAEALKIFAELPKRVVLKQEVGRGGFDVVVLFVENAAQLAKRLPAALKAGASGGVLWVAYPKLSSGRATTLSRDAGWEPTQRKELTPVTMIAFDETWSGVKYKIA